MKRSLLVVMVLALIASGVPLFASGSGEKSAAAEKSFALRYAHSNVPIYFYHTAGNAFAQEVDKATGGTVKITLYPQGQLGGERDVTEGLQLGTIDFQASSIGVSGTFVPALQILNLPFLFTGPKHWMAVMDGPVGKELLEKAQKEGDAVGLKVLAIAAPDFRLPMNNKKAIQSKDDFKGLKFRTMEVPAHMDAYRAIGASPVPLPFGELYTALQTGVVDGNENGPLALLGNRFYEVQKYLTLLPVVSNGGIFLMSSKTFDKLSKSQQAAVLGAVDAWKKKMNADALEQGGKAIEEMKTKGIQVSTITDLKPFVDTTGPVYENFYKQLKPESVQWAKGMIKKIQDASAGIVEGDWFAK